MSFSDKTSAFSPKILRISDSLWLLLVAIISFIYLLFFLILWHFHLHFIESLTVNTDDRTLTYKCVGVYHLYQPEDIHTLTLLCQQTQHLHLPARIPSVSVENRYRVFRVLGYGVGYLLVFARENKELHRLSSGIHHVVQREAFNANRTQCEHHLVDSFEISAERGDEHTAAHYHEVYENEYLTQ